MLTAAGVAAFETNYTGPCALAGRPALLFCATHAIAATTAAACMTPCCLVQFESATSIRVQLSLPCAALCLLCRSHR